MSVTLRGNPHTLWDKEATRQPSPANVTSAGVGRRDTGGMYSWPLKPFDQAHPVRGYFNDPRISGKSRAFHFGIDIAAPNGTPVYAVRAGVVHLEGQRSLSIADGDIDLPQIIGQRDHGSGHCKWNVGAADAGQARLIRHR